MIYKDTPLAENEIRACSPSVLADGVRVDGEARRKRQRAVFLSVVPDEMVPLYTDILEIAHARSNWPLFTQESTDGFAELCLDGDMEKLYRTLTIVMLDIARQPEFPGEMRDFVTKVCSMDFYRERATEMTREMFQLVKVAYDECRQAYSKDDVVEGASSLRNMYSSDERCKKALGMLFQDGALKKKNLLAASFIAYNGGNWGHKDMYTEPGDAADLRMHADGSAFYMETPGPWRTRELCTRARLRALDVCVMLKNKYDAVTAIVDSQAAGGDEAEMSVDDFVADLRKTAGALMRASLFQNVCLWGDMRKMLRSVRIDYNAIREYACRDKEYGVAPVLAFVCALYDLRFFTADRKENLLAQVFMDSVIYNATVGPEKLGKFRNGEEKGEMMDAEDTLNTGVFGFMDAEFPVRKIVSEVLLLLGLDACHKVGDSSHGAVRKRMVEALEAMANGDRSEDEQCVAQIALDFLVNAHRTDGHKLMLAVSPYKAEFVMRVCEGVMFGDSEAYMECVGTAEMVSVACGFLPLHEIPVYDFLRGMETFEGALMKEARVLWSTYSGAIVEFRDMHGAEECEYMESESPMKDFVRRVYGELGGTRFPLSMHETSKTRMAYNMAVCGSDMESVGEMCREWFSMNVRDFHRSSECAKYKNVDDDIKEQVRENAACQPLPGELALSKEARDLLLKDVSLLLEEEDEEIDEEEVYRIASSQEEQPQSTVREVKVKDPTKDVFSLAEYSGSQKAGEKECSEKEREGTQNIFSSFAQDTSEETGSSQLFSFSLVPGNKVISDDFSSTGQHTLDTDKEEAEEDRHEEINKEDEKDTKAGEETGDTHAEGECESEEILEIQIDEVQVPREEVIARSYHYFDEKLPEGKK